LYFVQFILGCFMDAYRDKRVVGVFVRFVRRSAKQSTHLPQKLDDAP
jgi:aminoglycoside/choline kinase family phosphotransferase